MALSAANLFKGIQDAKARIDANYIRPCHILLRIDACKIGETRKGDGFFVVEGTVIEDLVPDEFGDHYGHRMGENVSHMMMAKHDSFLSNVKAFIKVVTGVPEEDIEPSHAEEICADDQPLQFTVIEVVARETTTRENRPFTVVNYKGEVSPADLLERWSKREDGEELKERFFPGGLLEKLAPATS